VKHASDEQHGRGVSLRKILKKATLRCISLASEAQFMQHSKHFHKVFFHPSERQCFYSIIKIQTSCTRMEIHQYLPCMDQGFCQRGMGDKFPPQMTQGHITPQLYFLF
jgi:hypothetical protein